jgi:hypothetical protein
MITATRMASISWVSDNVFFGGWLERGASSASKSSTAPSSVNKLT